MLWLLKLLGMYDAPEPRPEWTPSRDEVEFLGYISRNPYNAYTQGIWSFALDCTDSKLDHLVDEFLKHGLCRQADAVESIAVIYTGVKLKEILKARSAPCSGKKSEQAKRIVDICNDNEVTTLIGGIRVFALSEAGIALVEQTKIQMAQEEVAAYERAVQFLVQDDIKSAAIEIANLRDDSTFPSGMGIDWSQGMPSHMIEIGRLIMSQDMSDVAVDEQIKKTFKAEVAIAEWRGRGVRAHEKRFLQVLPDRDSPCGNVTVFGQTIMHRAHRANELSEITKSKDFYSGVAVSSSNQGCSRCLEAQGKYSWRNLDKLPKLPLHWGCTCTYIGWRTSYSTFDHLPERS